MANGVRNGVQFPYPVNGGGKGEQRRLITRSQAILNALVNLLPSNYESSVVGPNYTIYMKAMATELARITMTLEQLGTGISFEEVQSEFLWETVGYLVFLNEKLPDIGFDDESFREFLLAIIRIYFQGATPASIADGVRLFTNEEFKVRENFKEGAPFDISDQFGFGIDFELQAQFPPDVFALDKNLQLLIEIIRPAHTLYRLRFVFKEDVDLGNTVTDESSWWMYNYYYDDARRYCAGMEGFNGTTGTISFSSLNVFTDTDPEKPLYAAKEGVTLFIPSGPNTGRYTVTGHPSPTSISVFPKFKQAESNIAYHVEVDRLGKKNEIFVQEDVSSQFYSTDRLSVSAGGPYTTQVNVSIPLTAITNGLTPTFIWDLDSDGVYEETGNPVNFVSAVAGTYRVWVAVTDYRGRRAKAFADIEVTI